MLLCSMVALFAMAPYVTQFLRKGELPERAGSAQPSGGRSKISRPGTD